MHSLIGTNADRDVYGLSLIAWRPASLALKCSLRSTLPREERSDQKCSYADC